MLFVWNKLFVVYLGFSVRNNRNDAFVALALVELNSSVDECVKRIVLTDSYVVAGIVLCATLANDDVTSNALLTAENLDTQSLSC